MLTQQLHPAPPPCRLLTVGAHEDVRPFYRKAFSRLASRLALPFEALFAAAPPAEGACPGAICGQWNVCTAGVASWAGSGGSGSSMALPSEADSDVSTCYCELVFSFTQVLLSVALPLLLLGCGEARQRRHFAAAQLRLQESGQSSMSAETEPPPRRRRRRRTAAGADWIVSFDRMRLLALLALIQVGVGCGGLEAWARGNGRAWPPLKLVRGGQLSDLISA